MAVFSDFPPEIVLLIVSLQTRVTVLDPHRRLVGSVEDHIPCEPELVPDLPTINSLSQTNIASHRTVDRTLYKLCASVEALGKLAVLFAVENQLEGTLDKFLVAKVRLGEMDFCGSSLLHIAADLGFRTMIVKLLGMYDEEMVYRRRYMSSQTALNCAVWRGDMEIVRLLAPISPSAVPHPDRSHQDYLSAALIEAVNAENVEISAYLISEGADVNFMGIFTPLYCAVAANTPALVQLLLASGAHPDGHTKDSSPFIPLCIAAQLGYLDIAQVLVEGGADIHMRGPRPKNVLLECTNIELLRFFLERGVDPNNEDRNGNTTLHTVCGKRHAEYGTAFIELLCQFGTVPDKTNSILRTTVDFALTNGLPHIVEIVEPYVQTPTLQARISRWRERRKKAET